MNPISVKTSLFTYKIVQQPANAPTWIALTRNTVTQYRLAANYGCVGLLAHSYGTGALFPQLTIAQLIMLTYEDSSLQDFKVAQIRRFKAVEPYDPFSRFIDLETGREIPSTDVFMQIYATPDTVTFETCFWLDGNAAGGRLFVVAK